MAMASDQPLTLMNIPLEVRHQIFAYVAVRDVKPEKLLRYWFEKKEVKEKMAELVAKDPNAGKPRVVYEGDQFDAEKLGSEDEEEGGDGQEDSDEDEDEGEGDENEGEDEEEDEAEEQDAEMADANSTAVPTAVAFTVPANAQGSPAAAMTNSQPTTQGQQDPAAADQTTEAIAPDQLSTDSLQYLSAAMAAANTMAMAEAQGSTVAAANPSSAAAPTQSQDNAEVEDADADIDEDDEADLNAESGAAEEEDAQMDDGEEDEDEDGNEGADGDSDEEMADEDEDGDTAAGAAQPPQALVITAHRKWRHIPQFMRITHCPPPVELLLTSKQLNTEAKSCFYDVAVLRIEATGSFAHTSFFEEAFSQITEAAFSPMEDIRKVEVTFVWDTTWLRSDRADCAAVIFPALLRQRAIFVTGILAQAPSLSEVTIHWHDSAEDEEALDLMNDVLMGFLGLDATVKVEPHYIAADAKPYRNSIAGKQRVEFQRIVNAGLDRLF